MRRVIGTLVLVLAGVWVVACGAEGESASREAPDAPGLVLPPIGAASLAELTGPWRAEPLGLDPGMAGRIADRCARDMEGQPGIPAQIIDVRGAGVAMARLSGPTSAIGCSALQITANGGIEGAGGGWRSNEAEVLPAIGLTEISAIERSTVDGGNLKVEGRSVLGRAGAGIVAVTVETAGLPVIVATVQNGWFAAWWPARLQEDPAIRIRGFGALGQQVAEETL
jgi:cell division septation protein DedD